MLEDQIQVAQRFAATVVFFIFGTVVTWASCSVGSRMRFGFDFARQLPRHRGCHEIGHCDVPWWMVILFLGYLFGPSLMFAIFGWRSVGAHATYLRTAIGLLSMAVFAFLFCVAAYALRL